MVTMQPLSRKSPTILAFVDAIALGHMYLSAGLTKKLEITPNSHKGAVLYYDKQHEVVALKLLRQEEDGMLRMKVGQNGGAFITARRSRFDMT
jgi:hypothetical protein